MLRSEESTGASRIRCRELEPITQGSPRFAIGLASPLEDYLSSSVLISESQFVFPDALFILLQKFIEGLAQDTFTKTPHHDTIMAHLMQRLRDDGNSFYSSADSLANISSHKSEGLLGPSDGARMPEITSPPENLSCATTSDMGARGKAERNEKGLHSVVKTASIPVRLEKVKNGRKGSYMLRMDDDLRQLLSQSRLAGGVNGKKRNAKFTDVGLQLHI